MVGMVKVGELRLLGTSVIGVSARSWNSEVEARDLLELEETLGAA
jgi:hypothetical protein